MISASKNLQGSCFAEEGGAGDRSLPLGADMCLLNSPQLYADPEPSKIDLRQSACPNKSQDTTAPQVSGLYMQNVSHEYQYIILY